MACWQVIGISRPTSTMYRMLCCFVAEYLDSGTPDYVGAFAKCTFPLTLEYCISGVSLHNSVLTCILTCVTEVRLCLQVWCQCSSDNWLLSKWFTFCCLPAGQRCKLEQSGTPPSNGLKQKPRDQDKAWQERGCHGFINSWFQGPI